MFRCWRLRKSNVLRPQPHLSTLESSIGHQTNGVEGFKVITVHPHHRSSLPNHILCGTMFQPLTKDHGDDNHLAVTSADSRGSQDLGRRPEMASAGFAMDRFVPKQKEVWQIIQCNYCQLIQSPLHACGSTPGYDDAYDLPVPGIVSPGDSEYP